MTDAQTKARAIAPERIWIEQDNCPYFYHEDELSEVGSPVTGYVREDIFAAKDAELAAISVQLAEARKALGMMLKEHDILSGNFGDVMDPKHKRPDRWPTAAEAARRALEAQGGE